MKIFESRKLVLFLVGVILILGSMGFYYQRSSHKENPQVLGVTNQKETDIPAGNLPKISDQPLPEKVNLDVPWISQAPLGVWDDWHDETCEEGAVMLVHYYLLHKSITPQEAEKELQNMVAWQISQMGEQKNLTASETVNWLVKKYYGHSKVRIVYDITLEDIKRELAAGNPVIVPAAGRELQNPHFTGIGPLYHMFVIKGYEPGWIIANEIGTRVGHNFKYNPDILYNAIHDWNNGDVANGRKVMIIIEK